MRTMEELKNFWKERLAVIFVFIHFDSNSYSCADLLLNYPELPLKKIMPNDSENSPNKRSGETRLGRSQFSCLFQEHVVLVWSNPFPQ